MPDPQRTRGSYAKGIAKREEILERALEVVAREGMRGASVRELADAVGLSQAGLLHYFDSKEELFTEILRKRDEIDLAERLGAGTDVQEGLHRVVRHNSEVPGVVALFSRLSVDAADPQHPAHAFFLERGERLRASIAASFRRRQEAGEIPAAADPEVLARIVQAAADGLQLQWMLDPDLDMADTLDALFVALTRPSEDAS
ncbi:TetR/AcrR family transcriptional regulator [Microbacterium sp. NPDC077184]|uniref:TetR/AcrR family transcriptional regulator n=1 Tax=Microbacterium sp. NPDC077184 TaxID=3154764 RepID=UPI00341C1E23